EGAKREPDRTKPQETVRVQDLTKLLSTFRSVATLTRRFKPASSGRRGQLPAIVPAGAACEFSLYHGPRFIHRERSAADFFAVVSSDCLFSVFIDHRIEDKAFRHARHTV